MIKWEYKYLQFDFKQLQQLGVEGWELVCVIPFTSGYVMILKKPLEES